MIKDEHYDAGLALRRAMFGSAGAEDQVEHTTDLNDKIQEVVTRYCFGDVWQREGLDLRTRSLITLAMLVATGRSHEIRIHLRGAVANGATEEEIRELMLHSFLYCGIPAAMDGFRAVEEMLSTSPADVASEEAAHV
ncbi:carboxymuconolactone decarboxylase family protein [Tersicoccus sp. Bi-70]|uniref:carboxymuconolactone decarboxylase family protein n=1 Tax=Tersicoccus sp. Bi-70 TaxID=1897634 RepID=UPI0009753DCC|nr:carboxymuconolactone decarboxylase family protein [Tersicoccus sp. Bi-70]OMH34997.1 4-carboxymuconolactone decarboxylase [Tersicoccus sp. Bi-70]